MGQIIWINLILVFNMEMRVINIREVKLSNSLPFVLIAGPCQIESVEHSLMIAGKIKEICDKLNINYIFKGSFDKANRSSIGGKRGIEFEEALKSFRAVREQFNIPILTDVHKEEQCQLLAEHVDILQIPAFLCRQTDLLEAAAKTAKVINIKKGQFLAPQDATNIVNKMDHFGNKNIILTERGVSFGYNNLVSDMRSLYIMSQTGCPVIFDATHSVQQPGGLGSASGGERKFVPILARAAIASTPIAGIFTEVHQDPDNAPSDGPCMLKLDSIEQFLTDIKNIDNIVKKL